MFSTLGFSRVHLSQAFIHRAHQLIYVFFNPWKVRNIDYILQAESQEFENFTKEI